jgi:Family of unknown function (DUF5681)
VDERTRARSVTTKSQQGSRHQPTQDASLVSATEQRDAKTLTAAQQGALKANAFQPGQSGNPNGRPKTKPITDALRSLLDEPYAGREKRFKGKSNACALATRLYELALGGDLAAVRECADRAEGKPLQRQEFGGQNGQAIPFVNLSREENEQRIMELMAKAGGPDREE